MQDYELELSALLEQHHLSINDIVTDSREVTPGSLFCCLSKGKAAEQHCRQAYELGACAIFTTEPVNSDLPLHVFAELEHLIEPWLQQFYGEKLKKLILIGVTGTNGKTTVACLLAQLLTLLGEPCAVLGTIGYGIWPQLQQSQLTTGNQAFNYRQLAKYVELGATYAVMEVSSHALCQQRVHGLPFDTAVFTNLTQDHLDYHQSMQAYGAAKAKLFHDYPIKHAVINIDDSFGMALSQQLSSTIDCQSLSLDKQIAGLSYVKDGVQLELTINQHNHQVFLPLLGEFNVRNLLSAISVLRQQGFAIEQILPAIEQVHGAPGRMQLLSKPGCATVVVDYAHTPDALQQALHALRVHAEHKLWCVYGCGGDRDQDKRAKMGAIAEQLADYTIITNDNPRTESPSQIIEHMLLGYRNRQQAIVMADRQQAITYAIEQADAQDIILIAGKGHEDYQIIGEQTLSFSDIDVAHQALEEISA